MELVEEMNRLRIETENLRQQLSILQNTSNDIFSLKNILAELSRSDTPETTVQNTDRGKLFALFSTKLNSLPALPGDPVTSPPPDTPCVFNA